MVVVVGGVAAVVAMVLVGGAAGDFEPGFYSSGYSELAVVAAELYSDDSSNFG